MKTAIITGGTGYIGMATARRFGKHFDQILIADTREPQGTLPQGAKFVRCDVRQPLEPQLAPQLTADMELAWLFNFAAVHREPGHAYQEYFDTNIPGAENVTTFAAQRNIANLFFTSSIAVYGSVRNPTDESAPKTPDSAYGISKFKAEQIHEQWADGAPERRLVICRPGVVYGPGDPGNILRLIHAVKRGRFYFPGNPAIHKSYAYIEGLLDSFEYTLAQDDNLIRYNYVETPTEPLCELVKHIEAILGKESTTLALPLWLLLPVAHLIQLLTLGRSPIHPKRVRKAAMPTHIVPQWLTDHHFQFQYDFATSLKHWKTQRPEDF